jgi:ATP/maltotriose-dependent transcriptional regulator MalT
MDAGTYDGAISAARRLATEIRRLLEPATAATHLAEARSAYDAGHDLSALGLLDKALAAVADPVARGQIQLLRGWIELRRDRPLATHELLLTEAAAVAPHDATLAVELFAVASFTASMTKEMDAAVGAATAAHRLARTLSADSTAYADLVLGAALVVAGGRDRGEPLVRSALEQFMRHDAPSVEPEKIVPVAALLLWLEEYDTARLVLLQSVERARSGSVGALPVLLDTLAALDYRTGRWAAAEARSGEALRLARELDQQGQIASCLTTLARLAAARGESAVCRSLVEEALELVAVDDLGFAYARSATGLLELGRGDADGAIRELEPLRRSDVVFREPMIVQWPPDLVEAYVRAGRRADAARVLRQFEEQARDRRRTWTLAVIERCRGLLASGEDFAGHFTQALEWHAQTATPFERARTELCFGERLRRARRGGEARSYLLTALGTFDRLGASAWAERARRELAGRRASPERGGPESLTSHEREVVSLVARGATNREAAAALFVSPKTIEYHLASAFRKLDVRSRTELALAVRDRPM